MKIYEILMMSGGKKKEPLVKGKVNQSGGTFSFYLNRTNSGYGGTTVTVPVDSNGYWEWNNDEGITITDLAGMFYSKSLLTEVDFSEDFDTSNVSTMNGMFYNCSFTSLDLSNFNTSNVTNTAALFQNCTKLTSLSGIENWDTSKVTNMSSMFSACTALTSLNLSGWDTNKVTNMSSMFYGCRALTSVGDLSGWDTSKVTDMSSMFYGCKALTSVGDLSGWDTSNVTNMSNMFRNCRVLTSVNFVNNWDTSNVTNMSYMFSDCCSLTTIDLSNLNTSKLTNVSYMFSQSDLEHISKPMVLASANLSGWDTSKVTDMSNMFRNCKVLTSLKLDNWTTTQITSSSNYANFVRNWSSLTIDYNSSKWNSAIPTSYPSVNWNDLYREPLVSGYISQSGGTFDFYLNRTDYSTGGTTITVPVGSDGYFEWYNDEGINITSLAGMFYAFSNVDQILKTIEFGNDAKNLPALRTDYIFYNQNKLVDVKGFENLTSTNMELMFFQCSGLTSIDFSGVDTSKVTNMKRTFSKCTKLTSVGDLSNWDTSKVSDITDMFYSSKLTSLKLDNWTTTQVTRYSGFVPDITTLTIDYKSSQWNSAIPTAFPNPTWNDISPATMDIYGTGTLRYIYSSNGTEVTESIALAGTTTPTTIDFGIKKNFEYFRPVTGQTNIVKVDMTDMAGAKPTSCEQMFYNMNNLTTIVGLDGLDYSRTTDTSWMFSQIYGLDAATGTAIGNMNLGESLTTIHHMFNGFTTTALDLNFDTKNVLNYLYMFGYCNTPVVNLDLDTSGAGNIHQLFEYMGYYGTSPTIDLTFGEKMFYCESEFSTNFNFDFSSIGTKLTTNSINSILQVAASVPRDGSVTNSLGNPIVGPFVLEFSAEQLGRADQDLVSAAQTAGYTIS